MVTWNGDGGMSGFDAATSMPIDVRYLLASNGMVDVEGVTRLQYQVTDAAFSPYSPSYLGITPTDRITSTLQLNFTQTDLDNNPGRRLSATMFVASAEYFAPGVTPTNAQILALGSSVLKINRATADFGTPGLKALLIKGPRASALQRNTKYWVLVMPTAVRANQTPSVANDTPINPNFGRGLSMWTNRPPKAPIITSPPSGTVASAGSTLTFSFTSVDDDRIAGSALATYSDLAGVQVQYAPRPSAENPSPVWQDLPIADDAASELGPGWWINLGAYNEGAGYLWSSRSMPLVCGSNSLVSRAGVLPGGSWQIRMRTFDFGHPYPAFMRPFAKTAPSMSVNDAPASNTSPWSAPTFITVSTQVPPPIPLSPVGSTALAEGTPVTLSWQYRNTFLPPAASTLSAGVTTGAKTSLPVAALPAAWPSGTRVLLENGQVATLSASAALGATTVAITALVISSALASGSSVIPQPYTQASRTVEIRKVGETAWSTLISGTGTASSYPVTPPPFTFSDDGTLVTDWSSTGTDVGYPTVVAPGYVRAVRTTPPTAPYTFSLSRNAIGAPVGAKTITVRGRRRNVIAGAGGPDPDVVVTLLSAGVPVASTIVSQSGTAKAAHTTFSDFEVVLSSAAAFDTVQTAMTVGVTGATVNTIDIDSISVTTPGYLLTATTEYEWRVQVTDSNGVTSNFSDIARFWIVDAPASGSGRPIPSSTLEGATLGNGTHRVYVYRRGGKVRVGEITGLDRVSWSRVRDDISLAEVDVSGWDLDGGNLLAQLQCWAYELVIFRDNGYSVDRVWEGPITLLTYKRDSVKIQAKDVMAYAYRRIIRQAMNDSKTGDTVTSRGMRILQNAFAPDDPNVLQWLQILSRPDDAMQYRSLPEYSRTAFEEVDDMAANAGLDYTTVGRAILLWGTRHRIGTLPEFRDSDLGDTPIVSEYGMSMANRYVVSNGNGIWGEANRLDEFGNDSTYGLVEMLSSSWASDSPDEEGTYSNEGAATVVASFEGFAERSIADRYPSPVVVRIPDNTTLSPSAVVSIQHLVPGVLIPLRSSGTLRSVVASQKLDSVSVVEQSKQEVITVVISPFNSDDTDAGEEEGA